MTTNPTTNGQTTDNTNALAIRAQSQALQKFNPEQIRIESQALRALMPKTYGRRNDRGEFCVTDEQLASLMIASLASGLSPARGEIYFIDTVGVMVASKVIAADAIAEQGRLGNTLSISFERVTPEMTELAGSIYARFAGAVKPGDVARSCRITSSKARADYYRIRAEIAKEGNLYGLRGAELMAFVNERAGSPPETIALGIVRASEKFGGDEKYSREARAEKRALKAALTMGGYWAMDRRNYGGVKLHDEVDASEETIEGDYNIVSNEPAFNAGVHGMTEPETDEPERKPISAKDRAEVSSLLDKLQQLNETNKTTAGMDEQAKAAFAGEVKAFIERLNAQMILRDMQAAGPGGTKSALAMAARIINSMIAYDESAPMLETEPAA